ncbi:hypothetical protein LOTGIDRAFT_229487 [Lottia gigantea]|uniref:EF-hand domain-containing protein n=1 Tax=Lottia gigantea TaxID=225164 RepID=V3Z4R2_LOTGI|nr:hypothetical protein LOTGIDRAFT_229487 [Lottia gigantea]ESO85683.1 hypothetical protein LOTGIDRAFT_229487 [Lottia gigantea]
MKCMLILVVILVVATLPQTEAGWRRFVRWLRTPIPGSDYGKKRNAEERGVVEEVTKEEFAATTGLTGAELDLYFNELDENDNGVLDGDEIMEASILYAKFSD